jgi:chorismate synthase
MLRFQTAGESHGQCLIALISGLPAGLPVDFDFINAQLHRRQLGYGRSGRQKIERDHAQALSGIRHGKTIGAPIVLQIENRDWANWQETMAVEQEPPHAQAVRPLTQPRPGHVDLAGCLKYNLHDARFLLERASARETAARVAAGALGRLLLREFGIEIWSHTLAVGGVRLERAASWEEIVATNDNSDSPFRCVDPRVEQAMKAEVDQALKEGDSVGGIFEVVAHHVPPGLGSHANWDDRLDGLLAQAMMSIQGVKAVEIGAGVWAAQMPGSEVHDAIGYDTEHRRFTRVANHAGGIEAGITNGEDVVVRGYLKPISTLRRPLQSVDLVTKEVSRAAYERADVCVVPAAGCAGEAMVGLTLARAFLEKFGGDTLDELRRNFEGYQQQLREF